MNLGRELQSDSADGAFGRPPLFSFLWLSAIPNLWWKFKAVPSTQSQTVIFLSSVSKAIFPQEPHGVILQPLERMTSGVGGNRVSSATKPAWHSCVLVRVREPSDDSAPISFAAGTSGESFFPISSILLLRKKCSTVKFPHAWPCNVFKLRILSLGENTAIEGSDHLAGGGHFITGTNFTDMQTLQCIL